MRVALIIIGLLIAKWSYRESRRAWERGDRGVAYWMAAVMGMNAGQAVYGIVKLL